MAPCYKITHDSDVEEAFVVHLPQRLIQLKNLTQDLYILNPRYECKKHVKASLQNSTIHSTSQLFHRIELSIQMEFLR